MQQLAIDLLRSINGFLDDRPGLRIERGVAEGGLQTLLLVLKRSDTIRQLDVFPFFLEAALVPAF